MRGRRRIAKPFRRRPLLLVQQRSGRLPCGGCVCAAKQHHAEQAESGRPRAYPFPARPGALIGQQGFALHTSVPYGDINDTADNLQPVWQGAVQLLSEATTLLAQVVETGEFDRELLLERAREGYGCVTELADVLVREHHLTFRQAHEVVSRVVDLAQRQETPPPEWTSSLIDTAALEVIGRTSRSMRRLSLERSTRCTS